MPGRIDCTSKSPVFHNISNYVILPQLVAPVWWSGFKRCYKCCCLSALYLKIFSSVLKFQIGILKEGNFIWVMLGVMIGSTVLQGSVRSSARWINDSVFAIDLHQQVSNSKFKVIKACTCALGFPSCQPQFCIFLCKCFVISQKVSTDLEQLLPGIDYTDLTGTYENEQH